MSDTETLTAEETAYFESGGSTELKQPETPPAAPEAGSESPSEGDEQPSLDAGQPEAEGQPQKRDDRVPLATLLEERKQAKEARDKLREMERQNAVYEDRWRQIQEAQTRQQQPQQKTFEQRMQELGERPNPEQNIFAALEWDGKRNQLLAERQEALFTENEQRQRQTAEQQRHAELDNLVTQYWQQDSADFEAKNPDFGPAATFLAEARDKQLAAQARLYPQFATKQGRDAHMNAELKQIVAQAAQNGQSPAEYIYEIAKAYGYTTKPAAPEAQDAIEALGKQAEAMAGAKSLSGVGGSRPATTSVQTLLDMNDKDFAKALEKIGEDGFRRMAGG